MSYDYSENVLIQESAADLLRDELGWEVVYAYNTEQLGEAGTLGRKSYKEILLTRYFREALLRLNPWLTPAQLDEAQRLMEHRLSTASLLQINEEKIFPDPGRHPRHSKEAWRQDREKIRRCHRLPEPGKQPFSCSSGVES